MIFYIEIIRVSNFFIALQISYLISFYAIECNNLNIEISQLIL